MQLEELQETIVARLRPQVRRLAARQPQHVALALRRLVERAPQRFPTAFWRDEADREEFVAGVAAELSTQVRGGLSAVWLVILLQVLVPALIRALIEWWSERESHRLALVELSRRLPGEALHSIDSPGNWFERLRDWLRH